MSRFSIIDVPDAAHIVGASDGLVAWNASASDDDEKGREPGCEEGDELHLPFVVSWMSC